jgi:hypothetical protein
MNIAQIMKQAQAMQSKMADMENTLREVDVVGQSGNGAISITLSGKSVMKKIKIDPKLVDPAEVEMLEDLILAAHTDAKQKIDQLVSSKTEEAMGGLKLPAGIKLPF